MKNIIQRKEAIPIEGSHNIYIPKGISTRGLIDGNHYSVDIDLAPLEEGSASTPPEVTTQIVWDESFYLEWITHGFTDYSVVDIKLGGSSIATISTEERSVTVKGGELFDLDNGTEYEVTITAIIRGAEYISVPVLITPVTKIPINPLLIDWSSTEAELSWEDLLTDYAYYVVYLKNEDTQEIEQRINGLTLPSATVYGLTEGVNYSLSVSSVSELGMFESAKSVELFFTATDKPDAVDDLEVVSEQVAPGLFNVTFDWTPAPKAASYDLYVKEGEFGAFVKHNIAPILGTSYLIENVPLAAHEAYIISVNGANESAPSNIVKFPTVDYMILEDYEDSIIYGTRKTFEQIPYSGTVPISPYGMPNARPSWTITGASASVVGSTPNKSILVSAGGPFKYVNFRTENPIYLATYSFGVGIWTTNQNYVYLDFLTQDTELTNLQRPKNGYSIRFTRRPGEDKIALYKLVNGIAHIIPTYQTASFSGSFRGLLTVSSGGVITLRNRQTDVEIFSVIDTTYTSGSYMGFSVGTTNDVQIYGFQVY